MMIMMHPTSVVTRSEHTLNDTTMRHQKRAAPFLKAGLPIFIDKPLSPSIEEAQELVETAKKHNAPFMSCSALRYAKEVEDFLAERDEVGEILTGNSICSGDLIFYGVQPWSSCTFA